MLLFFTPKEQEKIDGLSILNPKFFEITFVLWQSLNLGIQFFNQLTG
jgi:hypothetical protein